jgi:uncharacterized protein (TIGR00369 family)
MNPPPHRRELPNTDGHNCFGCSPKNPAGLQLKFSTDGAAVYTEIAVPEHLCGWSRIVHGGVLATICDETMSWAAIHLLKRIALTQSMTIEYLRPARIGSALAARGAVRAHDGKNDAVMEAVVAEAGGEPCARATARFKVFSPAVARRLKIADEASIRWFEKLFHTP